MIGYKENITMLDIYTKILPGCFSKPEYYNEFYSLFPDSLDMSVYQKNVFLHHYYLII